MTETDCENLTILNVQKLNFAVEIDSSDIGYSSDSSDNTDSSIM